MYLQFIRKLTKYLHKTTSAGRFAPVQQQTTLTLCCSRIFSLSLLSPESAIPTQAEPAANTSHHTRLDHCANALGHIIQYSFRTHFINCSCGQVEPVLRHVMCCLPPIVVVVVVVFA